MTTRPLSTQTRNRGASRANPPRQKIPGGTFAAGLVTGVVITLTFNAIIPDQPPSVSAVEDAETAPASNSGSNFQFYTLLNELEVAVPDSALARAAASENTIYWLQAASFRSQDDAEQLRAQLLLLNLEARTSPSNIQGNIWHRVVVGPYNSRTQMESARKKLVEAHLQPMVLPETQPKPVTR